MWRLFTGRGQAVPTSEPEADLEAQAQPRPPVVRPYAGPADDFESDEPQQNQAVPSLLFFLFFILLIFQAVPAGMAFFFLASLSMFVCLRAARLQAEQTMARELAEQGAVAGTRAGSQELVTRHAGGLLRALQSGQVVVMPRGGRTALRMQPAGTSDAPHTAVELEALLMSHLAHQIARAAPAPTSTVSAVTDEEMATLPTHTYHKPRPNPHTCPRSLDAPGAALDSSKQGVAGESAAADATTVPVTPAAAPSSSAGQDQAVAAVDAKTECQGREEGAPGTLTCSICLEVVDEGGLVMTLPCLHQYHASCVQPWIRQQGRTAQCPMCKTPVFVQ
ncbi:hypothetical protein V8C86DRAFT_2533056 [Haematococcus lacustris]